MSTIDRSPHPPDAVRTVLDHLREDAPTFGSALAVRADDRLDAVSWVRTLQLNPLARRDYYSLAAEWVPAPPIPDEPLDAERAAEAMCDGPDALTDDELARLLLSPRALADLDEWLYELTPDWWRDEMREAGYALAKELGIELVPPAVTGHKSRLDAEREVARRLLGSRERKGVTESSPVSAEEPRDWAVALTAEAREFITRIAFAGVSTAFALTLHRVGEASCDLEMTPAPLVADIVIMAPFPGGEKREFVVRVPAEVNMPGFTFEDVPLSVHSDPCAELSDEAFGYTRVELRFSNSALQLHFMQDETTS